MFHLANLLAVSATCNKEIRRTVMKELGLQKESTTLIVRSPDTCKSNIKYYVKQIDSPIELSMQWLLHSLELEAFPRTFFNATKVKQVSDLYNYLFVKTQRWLNK